MPPTLTGDVRQSPPQSEPWWKSAVLYQIYPRSFADSNGDGAGDLSGIIDHLDHLQWLGIDGIWLSPVTVSPNADWGYDVSDYCAIQPDLGSMEDLDLPRRPKPASGASASSWTGSRTTPAKNIRGSSTLVRRRTAAKAGLVRLGRPEARRLASQQLDQQLRGTRPGPSTRATGQYYIHNHLVEQPDLNWWNDDVRAKFDRHHAILVRPGSGRFQDRRVQHHDQRCAASGQPSCHRGRRLRSPDVRPAAGLQLQPARSP